MLQSSIAVAARIFLSRLRLRAFRRSWLVSTAHFAQVHGRGLAHQQMTVRYS
jgi:hypothetical protein